MADGFDLYSANRPAPIRSFLVRSTKKYIKGGVFAEGGRAIVCGSDHGKVYVFAIADTKPKQELVHGNRKQMIQTVSVRQRHCLGRNRFSHLIRPTLHPTSIRLLLVPPMESVISIYGGDQ